MGIKREFEIWLTVGIEAAVEQCRQALSAMDCHPISSTSEGAIHRVTGHVPRSFRHNRWAADLTIDLSQVEELVRASVTVDLAGNKHSQVLSEFRKGLGDITTQAPDVSASDIAARASSTVDALPKQVQKHTRGHIGDGEPILFFLEGTHHQTLVALADRVVILKPGFAANATGGCRVTTIHYREMTGIQVNTGRLMGVLQVTSPSYPAVRADYWTAANKATKAGVDSASVAPNCIPIAKRQVEMWEPRLQELRSLISRAHAPRSDGSPTTAAQAPSAADRLKQLAELRDAGIVTDEEFEAKKTQLLGEL